MIYGAILAGGIGERLGFSQPKQFIKIDEKPILIYSVEKFLMIDEFEKIIITLPENYIEYGTNLIREYIKNTDKLVIIEGGATRNDSILNSITYIKENNCSDDSILVTHDAARMFVTTELIEESIKYSKIHTAATPVVPVTELIYKSKIPHKITEIPLREHTFHSQSPQSFKINRFLEIYGELTDSEIDKLYEAMSLFFLKNEDIYLFEGDSVNFKITKPIDLAIAEVYIEKYVKGD